MAWPALHRIILALLATALLSSACAAQAGGQERIQAVIGGTVDGQRARAVADHLAARPGVSLCRVDPVSRNVLMHVDGTFRMTEQAIRQLFLLHGMRLRCLVRQPRTNAPFQLLDPRTCSHTLYPR